MGRSHDRVGLAAMSGKDHALGQGEIGQVQRDASQQVAQIDFDELGQVGRQADDFEFSQNVADDWRR